jgi:hypothetical protein
MDQLLTLLNLLLISQKSADSLLRQEQVTQAPILTSVITSEEEEWCLDAVLLRVSPLNHSIQKMANQVDFLMNSYHAVMIEMSEKVVAADEKMKHSKERACNIK